MELHVSDPFHCAAKWQTKAQPTTIPYIYAREWNEQPSWLGSRLSTVALLLPPLALFLNPHFMLQLVSRN